MFILSETYLVKAIKLEFLPITKDNVEEVEEDNKYVQICHLHPFCEFIRYDPPTCYQKFKKCLRF